MTFNVGDYESFIDIAFYSDSHTYRYKSLLQYMCYVDKTYTSNFITVKSCKLITAIMCRCYQINEH